MPTSHTRGHKIEYANSKWQYCDTKEDISSKRACKRCGKAPTRNGYDACLGYILGAVSACCGHGVAIPIMVVQ